MRTVSNAASRPSSCRNGGLLSVHGRRGHARGDHRLPRQLRLTYTNLVLSRQASDPHNLLAPVYGRFTKAFAADLKNLEGAVAENLLSSIDP